MHIRDCENYLFGGISFLALSALLAFLESARDGSPRPEVVSCCPPGSALAPHILLRSLKSSSVGPDANGGSHPAFMIESPYRCGSPSACPYSCSMVSRSSLSLNGHSGSIAI